jgi:hypothetical protein
MGGGTRFARRGQGAGGRVPGLYFQGCAETVTVYRLCRGVRLSKIRGQVANACRG